MDAEPVRAGPDLKSISFFPATMVAMRMLADEKQMAAILARLAGWIAARQNERPNQPWALIGVRSRGDVIAKRLAAHLDAARLSGCVGALDITLYRDDLSEVGPQPIVRTTEIPFAIDQVNVVLVDDVLMTGRSIRAALQSLMDLGRPARIWLAVVVDRGGRELPIAPDFVGLDVATQNEVDLKPGDQVRVMVTPTDDRDGIVVQQNV